MQRDIFKNIIYWGERLIVALSFSLILTALLPLLTASDASAQSINRTIIRAGQAVKESEAEDATTEDATAEENTAETTTEGATEERAAVADIVGDSTAAISHSGGIISTNSAREIVGDGTTSVDLSTDIDTNTDTDTDTDTDAETDTGGGKTIKLGKNGQPKRNLRELVGEREKFFSDSMSLSSMAWKTTFLPGYGQIYNKQYWKLPILYGSLATGLSLFFHENSRYKPLKAEYDALSIDLYRNEKLDAVQTAMIRSNTRRQLYLGATVASFLYFIGDATLNYATNDVSDIKRATTLAMICPGAGQIYNKSYWKMPIVIGGFATLIYVVDWNNRGYQRFKTAYKLTYAWENGEYSDPIDEFGGQYPAEYLKGIRQSYRRARDLSIIMLAGLYILQIVDAHVDAHFKDYDISDNLSVSIEPTVSNVYSPATGRTNASYGFSVAARF